MKTIRKQIRTINQFLEKIIESYLQRVTGAFFPKEQTQNKDLKQDDDDDEPILFI